MKRLLFLALATFMISCQSLSRFIELSSDYIEFEKPRLQLVQSKKITNQKSTLLIEIDAKQNNFKIGDSGVFLTYNDTISYFDESTYVETVEVKSIEIPIKILSVK